MQLCQGRKGTSGGGGFSSHNRGTGSPCMKGVSVKKSGQEGSEAGYYTTGAIFGRFNNNPAIKLKYLNERSDLIHAGAKGQMLGMQRK